MLWRKIWALQSHNKCLVVTSTCLQQSQTLSPLTPHYALIRVWACPTLTWACPPPSTILTIPSIQCQQGRPMSRSHLLTSQLLSHQTPSPMLAWARPGAIMLAWACPGAILQTCAQSLDPLDPKGCGHFRRKNVRVGCNIKGQGLGQCQHHCRTRTPVSCPEWACPKCACPPQAWACPPLFLPRFSIPSRIP
jgi:hypothetical protein